MNNKIYIGIIVFVILVGSWYFRPKSIVKKDNHENISGISVQPNTSELPQLYKSDFYKFSINLPEDFVVDEKYRYESTPQKSFAGVRFSIPKRLYEGTNLSSDTYISYEYVPGVVDACIAQMFLDSSEIKGFADVAKRRYTIAYSLGAGAGNRYEETVYATPVGDGCVAIRYFIHYGVFENYPEGSISKFDEVELKKLFDSIRVTLNFK